MKNFSTLILILLFISCKAQTSDQNELKLKQLKEKKIEFHKKTDGEYDGFRVKIHIGTDKEKARAVKSAFLKRFGDTPAYEKYLQPNFTIMVGDFRTKMEAYACYRRIKGDFPSAFIIKDRIRPVRL
ncbi:MAG: hypothetical protein IAF38_22955 [Bacteroidia bacterium]|nr:hypothetical protein [Bacteroidia bacterium]